jgi:hypothetical protein
VAEHFIEGEIGEGGGFAGLAFPKECPATVGFFDERGEGGLLIGTASHKINFE